MCWQPAVLSFPHHPGSLFQVLINFPLKIASVSSSIIIREKSDTNIFFLQISLSFHSIHFQIICTKYYSGKVSFDTQMPFKVI